MTQYICGIVIALLAGFAAVGYMARYLNTRKKVRDYKLLMYSVSRAYVAATAAAFCFRQYTDVQHFISRTGFFLLLFAEAVIILTGYAEQARGTDRRNRWARPLWEWLVKKLRRGHITHAGHKTG